MTKNQASSRLPRIISGLMILIGIFVLWAGSASAQTPVCNRTITADVVAFDQIFFYNRLGSFDPGGMIFALRRDVVPIDPGQPVGPGNAQLRPDKRPRPIVLRAHEGDCLQVVFTNWLDPNRADVENLQFANLPDHQPYFGPPVTLPNGTVANGEVRLSQNDTPATRNASFHVNGLDLVGSIASDGSNVGQNTSSLAAPGQTKVYTYYAAKAGQYLAFSTAATSGGEGDGGQIPHGLFGEVNVEPAGSIWYRSQVTAAQMIAATKVNPDQTLAQTPLGQPIIDYDKVDANGDPILGILKGDEIIHTDLNAIITDPSGHLQENCDHAPPSGTCGQPFREFSIVFHDELETGKPAFPDMLQDVPVFKSVRDGFGINYGSSGLGSELLANRKHVGPQANCVECQYEEFFLESWNNSDPAQLVAYGPPDPVTGIARAIAGLFPDDPSNVHHSYIGDPVRMRNVHAGPKETHVFHLHQHQWLQSPRDENSTYLDSQTISPGASFTYEIQYGGGGNRNLGSPGDSIFHCHLYPHFAQGMWELWRNHDVFEAGTPGLNDAACAQSPLGCPNPNPNGRNLPDGEIAGGIEQPALVPIPFLFQRDKNGVAISVQGMAPMPATDMPGYPFYMAAQAGHRPPQPAIGLDRDGGLQRHRVLAGTVLEGLPAIAAQYQADPIFQRVKARNPDPNMVGFAKKLADANIELLPPNGTTLEVNAQEFHQGIRPPVGTVAQSLITQHDWPAIGYTTFSPLGTTTPGIPTLFLVNGLPPAPGAPYSDPCPPTFRDDNGAFRTTPIRHYRTAWIQFDMTINTAGWHDRQARIAVLEQDALPTLAGTRPPEPLFFRANSGDCIDYRVTNLIPANINLDDFQVYQGSDIIGQHIHLVKFDVTSSDGAGNGWNYESGAFSPEEVRDLIEANNSFQQSIGGSQILSPVVNPAFGAGPNGDFVGAQTLIERWWADPLVNTHGKDRTIRTVFTHDHFSPSGHQHHGLYAGLVIEPTDAQWKFLDGAPMGGPTPAFVVRADGGPTSFAANLITADPALSYREFMFEIGDFAIVYTPAPELQPVNPPNRVEHPLPIVAGAPIVDDPSQFPLPEAISSADPGTQVVNYRNEPIPLRIGEKNAQGQFVQKAGDAGDLAKVFDSRVHGDPFTRLLKAYENDNIQIRLLQGAQEEQHIMNVHGIKWLFEPGTPSDPLAANNSGYTNAQYVGISEHFNFLAPVTGVKNQGNGKGVDYLWQFAASDNLWDGMWGLLRTFNKNEPGLAELPNNPVAGIQSPNKVCPQGAPIRQFFVDALLARDLLPGGTLVYNNRFNMNDPNAILYVEESDIPALQAGTKQPEPLILRAAAGDCINVTFRNNLPAVLPEADSWNFMPPIVPEFNFNQIRTSNRVSLHPQLLSFKTFTDDGADIGFNNDSTLGPGQNITYIWYAGDRKLAANGNPLAAPIEFGATGLRDYGDVIKHASHGAIGSLIIEPFGSNWTTVGNSKASADIKNSSGVTLFREFVVLYQDDLSLQKDGVAMMNVRAADDSEDSGMKGYNYRSEPLFERLGFPPETDLQVMNAQDYSNTLSSIASNPGCGGACGDPATPVFTATAGTPVRFRVLHVAGHPRQHGYTVFGHHWNFEPWTQNSTVQGNNPFTFEVGSYSGIGPSRHLNILTTAGGLYHIPGDYLYRTQDSIQFSGGLWGIFRVTP
jgi:manganese oxidase